MGSERTGHTLQPTALVHEAWLKLMGGEAAEAADERRHFMRLAAQAMRHTLVDHARRRGREKRGGDRQGESLDELLQLVAGPDEIDVVELSDALEELARFDEGGARIVELRFFAGLSIAETADVLGLSTATVERGWRVARLWLSRELRGDKER